MTLICINNKTACWLMYGAVLNKQCLLAYVASKIQCEPCLLQWYSNSCHTWVTTGARI